MTNEPSLTQLAAELAHLRRQIETVNQRLDMIYGAVTRLADRLESPSLRQAQGTSAMPTPPPGPVDRFAAFQPDAKLDPFMSPTAMMSPDSMLDALHQFAVKSGLDVSQETVDRLKQPTTTE